ncbi:MAG: acetyl-CoA carboxylase biotin carboxyl carrier protein subunit [Planctomycetota bacterium]|nr:MAG: acetyl-CoA carboxylase biotin carboxyl carrier protein subunit [Planctomycetota bacterium]
MDETPSLLEGSLQWLRSIAEVMQQSELSEVTIEERGRKIRLRRGSAGSPLVLPATAPLAAAPPPPAPGAAPARAAASPGAGEHIVTSPMVGTFYRAPSPEAEPFVAVGDEVKEDTVLCIIEAMKVMNEIRAEVAGTIEEILVANGEAVEYGQPLFRIRLAA